MRNRAKKFKIELMVINVQGQFLLLIQPIKELLFISPADFVITDFEISSTDFFWVIWALSLFIICISILHLYFICKISNKYWRLKNIFLFWVAIFLIIGLPFAYFRVNRLVYKEFKNLYLLLASLGLLTVYIFSYFTFLKTRNGYHFLILFLFNIYLTITWIFSSLIVSAFYYYLAFFWNSPLLTWLLLNLSVIIIPNIMILILLIIRKRKMLYNRG